ncbi:MAG: hypothetical protein V4760_02900, partial [Bdellovibrionota bacterium]
MLKSLVLGSLIIAPVFASAGHHGTIESAPAIMSFSKGEPTNVALAAKLTKFDAWDSKKNVVVYTEGSENGPLSKCGISLGLLAKPVSMTVALDGKKMTMTIPARNTGIHSVGGCDAKGNPKVVQFD